MKTPLSDDELNELDLCRGVIEAEEGETDPFEMPEGCPYPYRLFR